MPSMCKIRSGASSTKKKIKTCADMFGLLSSKGWIQKLIKISMLLLFDLFLILYVFLIPPALTGVPLVWCKLMRILRNYTRTVFIPCFRVLTYNTTIHHHVCFLCVDIWQKCPFIRQNLKTWNDLLMLHFYCMFLHNTYVWLWLSLSLMCVCVSHS